MSRSSGPAPLYADAFDLSQWLFNHFGDNHGILPQELCKDALRLLDCITLAFKNRRREEHMEMADEYLIQLRVHLRLAREVGYLDDAQLLYALEKAETIGRQLGGWLRSLDPL